MFYRTVTVHRNTYMFRRMIWTILTSFAILCETVAVIIKTRCPRGEAHRSCFYFRESECWTSSDMLTRSLERLRKLDHCVSACVCRSATVRAYPEGPCIPAASCKGRALADKIESLPVEWKHKPSL
ncbi:hypothetical protein JYU34_001419 [Plutella xylostella]|uniref:Secreted protein n=1 Tax=Plutella xylostella TaxID=51655 RepID=A0ABQ7R3Y2_PLUXY|nr:hypothetical protein JYU34_001419 [Plutella xylostella]